MGGAAEGGSFPELCCTRLCPGRVFPVVIHSKIRCTIRHFALCSLLLLLCHTPLIVLVCLTCLPLFQPASHKRDWDFFSLCFGFAFQARSEGVFNFTCESKAPRRFPFQSRSLAIQTEPSDIYLVRLHHNGSLLSTVPW